MSDIREAFEEVEQSVACGDMSAAQVFTQMRQIAMSALQSSRNSDGKDNAILQAQTSAQEARTQKGIVEEIGKLVGCSNDWEMVSAVKAALQSQTAPAVPVGWMLVPVEPTGDMQEAGAKEIRFNTTAINKLWTGNRVYGAMLAAAPQPDGTVTDYGTKSDHSPDAGKVVGDHYDLGVALSRHFDELRDSETGHIAFDPCDSNDIDEVLAIISAHLSPAPAADGGEVVPVGWIWETYGQRNFTAGTHHKNVLEADGLTLIPVYTHPAQPRNELDSEDQKGMERIVEAVAHIGVDFGYGPYELEQCHIDRAREIKESLDRLGSDGGDV